MRCLALCLAIAAVRGAVEKKYGVVFDAGSSGTRIHVYTWKVGGGGAKDAFDLQSDELLKIKPGLSAYKDAPSTAGASLTQLIDFAKGKIPADQIASTPMFLMATAGLRMVGEAAKDAILASVCSYLSTTGFIFKCGWATLLDGRDEGLYGWVTVNYLLDALYPGVQDPVGIIDLGGGSIQTVFPTLASSSAPAGYTQQLDFGGRKHNIYVKSHLGFGLDAARNSVLDMLLTKSESPDRPVRHPCLPVGGKLTYKTVSFEGAGEWKRCSKLVKKLFDDDDDCKYGKHMCSIKGTYQPTMPPIFYGFSYLWDRTGAIGLLDNKPSVFGQQKMSRDDIESAGKAICALDHAAAATRFAGIQDAAKSDNFCGDVAYLEALLDVLGFNDSQQLTMTNKIKEVELVWTLGAMLAESAKLASGVGSSSGLYVGLSNLLLLLLALGACFCLYKRASASRGPPVLYRNIKSGDRV